MAINYKYLIKKNKLPSIIIVIILIAYVLTNFYHHRWTITGENRGVIKWDVISYYAYLPATIIHGDPSLSFIEEPDFVNDNKFWFVTTEEGNKVILTSMGLSILYAPFFFVAHILAPLFGEARDGFGSIYQFFIVFSSLAYVILAFILLYKILRRYFSQLVSSLTLLMVGLATNIYYYTTYEAAMTHAYSFSLIILLYWLIIKWYEKPLALRTVGLGLVYGLIVLVRPTNILLIIVFILYGVGSFSEFGARIRMLLQRWPAILLMVFAFTIPWIPQFIYWYKFTGQLFYNAYEEVGSAFFFDSPKIIQVLFSYRKGWFVYVPVMFFAFLGFIPLFRKYPSIASGIFLHIIVMLYVLSSWWSWWTGGSFGIRSFVDFYGLLAFPLAALIKVVIDSKRLIIGIAVVLAGFLIYLNIFQSWQYFKGMIHWVGMTKEAYWLQFLRGRSAPGYWESLSMPDFPLARQGVYYFYHTGEDYEKYAELSNAEAYNRTLQEIRNDKKLMDEIERLADEKNISQEEALEYVAKRVHEAKMAGGPK